MRGLRSRVLDLCQLRQKDYAVSASRLGWVGECLVGKLVRVAGGCTSVTTSSAHLGCHSMRVLRGFVRGFSRGKARHQHVQ